jgi:hypothetical protein
MVLRVFGLERVAGERSRSHKVRLLHGLQAPSAGRIRVGEAGLRDGSPAGDCARVSVVFRDGETGTCSPARAWFTRDGAAA